MNLKKFFTETPWWGKIIGAFFGYLASGPMGTLLGLLIGNLFDRGLATHFSNPHFLYHAEKKKMVQKIFFEATFAVMGHIAKADGHVSAQEIQMAKTLMQEMRLSKEQKQLAKRLFTEGKQPSFKLDLLLIELKKACRDNRELLKLFIDIQYRAAQIDGLTIHKIKALDLIFSQLGFAPLHQQYKFFEDFGSAYETPEYNEESDTQQSNKQNAKGSYQRTFYNQSTKPGTIDHAFAILETNPAASKQEVKKAYRRLLSKNHPDKLIAQGLPENMIKMANDKTHTIRKAYELICTTKGWS